MEYKYSIVVQALAGRQWGEITSSHGSKSISDKDYFFSQRNRCEESCLFEKYKCKDLYIFPFSMIKQDFQRYVGDDQKLSRLEECIIDGADYISENNQLVADCITDGANYVLEREGILESWKVVEGDHHSKPALDLSKITKLQGALNALMEIKQCKFTEELRECYLTCEGYSRQYKDIRILYGVTP